jgi:hypothetical protein
MTVWLRSNTRAMLLGMIPPGLAAVAGIILSATGDHQVTRIGGALLAACGTALVMLLVWQVRLPRVACDDGQLLVYLQGASPIRVPLEIVECFLLGQAPAMLPGRKHELAETASVVIRLSETAEEWKQRDVKPALGKWCDGYITIRGTWCEPLSIDLVYRLNAQLAEARQALRQSKVAS